MKLLIKSDYSAWRYFFLKFSLSWNQAFLKKIEELVAFTQLCASTLVEVEKEVSTEPTGKVIKSELFWNPIESLPIRALSSHWLSRNRRSHDLRQFIKFFKSTLGYPISCSSLTSVLTLFFLSIDCGSFEEVRCTPFAWFTLTHFDLQTLTYFAFDSLLIHFNQNSTI